MIPGVDCGSPQGGINDAQWHRIQRERPWAALRCVEGLGGKDSTYLSNRASAEAAGELVCAYFVLEPWSDPVAQARTWFVACSGLGSKSGGLPPALDFELDHDSARAMTPAQVFTVLVACVREMTRLWCRPPTLYTYPFFWHAMLAGASPEELVVVATTNLWLAAYKTGGNPPAPLSPWTRVTFWQESGGDEYKTPAGAPCDADFFLGSASELSALASFSLPVEDPLAGVPVPGLVIPGSNT